MTHPLISDILSCKLMLDPLLVAISTCCFDVNNSKTISSATVGIILIFSKSRHKQVFSLRARLIIFIIKTVHEQGGCLVLSSCFNGLYFTKVNLILLVRVVGWLRFMSYVTE